MQQGQTIKVKKCYTLTHSWFLNVERWAITMKTEDITHG